MNWRLAKIKPNLTEGNISTLIESDYHKVCPNTSESQWDYHKVCPNTSESQWDCNIELGDAEWQ